MNNNRNIFLYWTGKEYKFINILRNFIYLHSTNGIGYNVILITHENVKCYIKNIPNYFYNMLPALQADFVRVNVICDYGGIWLDSDTLVLDSLDSLFEIIDNSDGFLVIQPNNKLCNGIFSNKKNTDFIIKWKNNAIKIFNEKKGKIAWTEIGNNMLETMYKDELHLFQNYKIFKGADNLYPINWTDCVNEFIIKPYDNYKNIIRDYQPLIVLVNSVYKELENENVNDIFNGNKPINYFINKSIENMKLINYDFIEIGTSNFDTLIQNASDNTLGISIDVIKYYLDQLPDKNNVKKINIGISDKKYTTKVYYIPENIIKDNNLPEWFKGCNSIEKYHPMHLKHNVTNYCTICDVDVIPCYELFYKNKVKNVDYLKIDTEGHDSIILKSLYNYIYYLPTIFYPKKILFETNELTKKIDIDTIIKLYTGIGYKIESRDYNTFITYSDI